MDTDTEDTEAQTHRERRVVLYCPVPPRPYLGDVLPVGGGSGGSGGGSPPSSSGSSGSGTAGALGGSGGGGASPPSPPGAGAALGGGIGLPSGIIPLSPATHTPNPQNTATTARPSQRSSHLAQGLLPLIATQIKRRYKFIIKSSAVSIGK